MSTTQSRFKFLLWFCSVCLILFLTSCSSLKKIPVKNPQTEAAVRILIDEGVKLHDKGNYDGAIQKYNAALGIDSENVECFYELSYSYYLNNQKEKSLEYALKGLEYESGLYAPLTMNAANCLDDLGRKEEAIKLYKKAIKHDPNLNLLHFNLGLTYIRMENYAEADKSFFKSISLKPSHGSSHYALGSSAYSQGKKSAVLLTLPYFLTLETEGNKAQSAREMFVKVIESYVNSVNKITLNFSEKDRTINALDLLASIKFRTCTIDNLDCLAQGMKSLIEMLDRMSSTDGELSKFLKKQYIPFYKEVLKNDYLEVLLYSALKDSKPERYSGWLNHNKDKYLEFLKWSEQFKDKKI